MISLDSWLEISFRIPVLLAPVLVLLLVVGGVVAWRRARHRLQTCVDEAAQLRDRLADWEDQEAQWAEARETYHSFIYNVSHEVANPLQSIQTNLDNMASLSIDEAPLREQYQAIIAAEVRRLARMTDNLRVLSRLETPEFSLVREPVNLMAVVEDVIMAAHEMAEARGVQLQCSGPKRPARVLGNRDSLRQVLMNLVDNSCKYSKDEGGLVVVSVQEQQNELHVRVSDEGIGIPEEDLEHVFDLAYRAPDAHSLRRRGSGLGLAIAKRIVEEHGGDIRVRSQLGEGTTISFDLPLYQLPQ